MNNSKSLSDTSRIDEIQLPLKGFRIPIKTDKPGRTVWIEGMGDGRYRVHASKSRK
jgi:hypothetical protein